MKQTTQPRSVEASNQAQYRRYLASLEPYLHFRKTLRIRDFNIRPYYTHMTLTEFFLSFSPLLEEKSTMLCSIISPRNPWVLQPNKKKKRKTSVQTEPAFKNRTM